MLGDMAMRDILTESREGTLRRQLASPVPAWQIVIGKALYTTAMAVITLTILALIGWSASGGAVDLPGFVVLSMAVVVMVTGYSSIIYAVAGNDRQGSTISSVLLLIFAFIGGSFVQIEALPAAVRSFSPFTPFYWGTTGYSSLLRQGGLVDVLPNVGVLAGVGAGLLAIGSMFLERKVRRGQAA
jgi:ABC-2 type transport system permease protein